MSAIVEHSDCRAYLATLATNSVDACTTDPPYELNFMGREWDRSGIANQVELWREVYRVLKPGAHLVAFGGTRTYHRMVCAIEDARFEIRDTLQWLYGSGFNKSHNVLKPAHEPIVLARKPLAKTVAATIAAYGTGGINVEACRIATTDNLNGGTYSGGSHPPVFDGGLKRLQPEQYQQPAGRWPPNLLLSHSAACRPVGTRKVRSNGQQTAGRMMDGNLFGKRIDSAHYADPDGTETVLAWACAPDCPVAALDRQSGVSSSKREPRGGTSPNPMSWGDTRADGDKVADHTDTGGASRFYPILNYDPAYDDPFLYCAKAGKKERGAGNNHPTVKPVALCRWLVRLVTPLGGTALDPFAGSGSFGVACVLEGRHYKGCDQDAEYVEIANRRIAATQPALIGV